MPLNVYRTKIIGKVGDASQLHYFDDFWDKTSNSGSSARLIEQNFYFDSKGVIGLQSIYFDKNGLKLTCPLHITKHQLLNQNVTTWKRDMMGEKIRKIMIKVN